MNLQLDLSPELAERLRARAAAVGEEPQAYALHALAEKLRGPRTFAEILAPIHQEVEESGMTDKELDSLFQQAIDESRLERKLKK